MAGLQYNFFPTDFYYPRPQTVPFNDAPGRVAAVIIQTQKKDVSGDDLEWPRSLGFRVHQGKNNIQANKKTKNGVSMHQNQDTAYVEDQDKLVKYSPNPLSWFALIPEELSDSS